jgi:hypothetical protein
MTGYEHEPQEVVADVIGERGAGIRHGDLPRGLDLATDLLVLALEHLVSPEQVDRATLCGGHQPGARVVWDARLRPLLERRDEDVLREILGKTDVSHDPREAGDESG